MIVDEVARELRAAHVQTSADPDEGYYRVSEFRSDIAKGGVAGYSYVDKFGENPDIDTGTYPEDIWTFGGVYTFSATADIDSISSSDATDTQDIVVQGLDGNWELTSETVTLNGQTRVALANNYLRVFRAYNDSASSLAGTAYIYVNGSITGGVPDTATDVRAVVVNGANQTEMLIYTIPAGKTGCLEHVDSHFSRSVSTGAASMTIRTREFGKAFRVKRRWAIMASGSSDYEHDYPYALTLPEKTDIVMRCEEVSANNTAISGGFVITLIDN
jgi:hypothetical protein